MKIKFTYQRATGPAVDLVATLDSQTTVGDLADHLVATDPMGRHTRTDAGASLCLHGRHDQVLDHDLPVADSPLSSGCRVSVVSADRGRSSLPAADAAATLRIESGPGAGTEFPLRLGAVVIGRDRGCDITLPDPTVSRRHVRLLVGDTVELHDLGSANGTAVGGQPVANTVLRPGDLVEIGDTFFSVSLAHQVAMGMGGSDAAVSFIRSPLITPQFAGEKWEVPQAPERPKKQRFPIATLIAPFFMAGVLVAITGNAKFALFVLMSPLIMVGTVLENRRNNRLDFEEAVAEYEGDLDKLDADLKEVNGREAAIRMQEHPPSHLILDAALRHSPLLWSRRPDVDDFLTLRLGVGMQPSRTEIEVPKPGRAPYELWQKGARLAERYRLVGPVPVLGNLRESALGVGGPRRSSLPVAWSLVAQAVGLHSPAELVVAGFFSGESALDWDWLKWLPHTSSPQSPVPGRHLTSAAGDAAALMTTLEDLIGAREDDYVAGAQNPAVLVIVEVEPPIEHNRLVHLAESGFHRGVHVIWIAPDWTELPAICRTFVSTPQNAAPSVGVVTDRVEHTPVQVDAVELSRVEGLGRELSPVLDRGARVLDASDIPRSVGQLSMLGPELGESAQAVIERWQESSSILTGPYAPQELPKRAGHLRAVVGQSASGPHTIDLRSDGPHALVGGTTGSGKSELLQAWILAMAITNSPQRVNFLLVDYKGGSAFADCTNLPHTIGLVTDLSPPMVRRALTSLGAELKYREELLHAHNAKDLIELERHGVEGAPPSLVLVVDEFAALVDEVPEFIEGVVNVAQRGRSLGLHLVLATQQPSGVIKGALRANTNLRIALRTADDADSMDIVGSPSAAQFDPDIPGRAMSRSGPTRLVAFQTGYAGGWSGTEPEAAQIEVEELTVLTGLLWEADDPVEAAPRDREQTDIKRVVRAMGQAKRVAELPDPRKAWLPVLPSTVDLVELDRVGPDGGWLFALGDDPERQAQPPVSFVPDREGNLAVYGTGGAGKSVLLRSLAIAAGIRQLDDPTHVYGLDFGSRALQMLEVLPHVGSIIPGADAERVGRLITWLRQTISERAARYAAVNAGTISEYRVRSGSAAEPRILVLVDNVGAFRSANETSERSKFIDMFNSVASEGRPVGVHLALSAGERTAMHTNLSSAVQRRLVMRMATEDDYSLLGVASDVLTASSLPGRSLDGEQEIQIGVLGDEGSDAAQARRLAALAKAMRSAGVTDAPPIRSLDSYVDLATLGPTGNEVTIGMDSDSLEAVGVDADGAFLVTGPPSSGRTTALRTIITSVAQRLPEAELHYFGYRRSHLAGWQGWTSTSTSPEEIMATAEQLAARITGAETGDRRIVVIVERVGDLVMSPAETGLQSLVKACIAENHWFLAEGEVSTVKASSGFMALIKGNRRGLALQPDQENGLGLFNTAFPRINPRDFPPGRGFLVGSGRASVIQVAVPPGG